MGRKRTTFSVAEFTAHVNHVLANSTDSYQQGRTAVSLTLEHILMETGNYRGFSHLPDQFLPEAERTPGNVLRPGYDDTRRHYN